jgi:hypothetical protein
MSARAVLDKAVTEAEFSANVLRLAKLKGWRLTYHTHRSDRSEPGFPDWVLVRPPRLLFLELKRERGKATPVQETWLAALAACGVEARLFRPSDWPQIERTLA